MSSEKYLEHKKKLFEQVYIKDEHIVINVKYEYDIPISQCDTAEKILYWVIHLCEKKWITNDIMGRFIAVACDENNIQIKAP